MQRVTKIYRGVSSSKIAAILNRSPFKNVVGQWRVDTKQEEVEFSEVGKRKTKMGIRLEPIIAELAEEEFGVTLTIDKTQYHHDDYEFMKVEFDGLDYENLTVYEFKNTEMEEEHIVETYYSQVQFAMWIIGWEKARIVYLQNGWNLAYVDIARDDNFIEFMVPACKYYWDCVVGMVEPDPAYIDNLVSNIQFYAQMDSKKGEAIDAEIDSTDLEKMHEWGKIKQQMQLLKIEEERYKGYFAEKLGKYKDDRYSFSNVEQSRQGSIDIKKLAMDYPKINIDKYRKPDTKFQRISLKYKVPKEELAVTINSQEDIV